MGLGQLGDLGETDEQILRSLLHRARRRVVGSGRMGEERNAEADVRGSTRSSDHIVIYRVAGGIS
eukprot:1972097-Pyramimonas_sp.AAC.1